MTEVIAGFSILAFLLVWHFVWKPTLFDNTRDRLFDLRDNVRTWFINYGYSLDHPMYIGLRYMLNSYIYNVEKVTLTKLILFMATKDSSLKEDLQLQENFETDDVDVLEFVNSVHHKASGILLSHMVKKNIFLFPFWGITKIIMVIVSLISSIFMFKTYSENTL